MISLDVYNNKALITIRGGRVCQGNHFGKMLDGASFTLSPDSPPGYYITTAMLQLDHSKGFPPG